MDMKTSEKVHEIGYLLKDAKIIVNQDLNFDVAGIKVESKQGEMMNLPRWVGQILEENGLGDLDSPDMITELKQALSKEKMIGEYQVSTLMPDFYIKLRASMKKLDRHDFDNVESVLLELFRMRRGKIVKLADSSKLTAELNSKLTVEEKMFFESISENSKQFERQIRGDADE
ncbi:MAG: DNA replication complex GINS family protein [Thaumarchaeota archaeon]|nr:DNA replication complex GINS family protein [Nitrososphaerota archaeon]